MRKIPAALAPVLYIPTLMFEILIRARNRSYAAALLPQQRLSRPVLSIGNMTLGGSGKTPLVVYVARTLFELGFVPVVLTRGYGRRHANKLRIVSPEQIVPSPDLILGDEPALMRRSLPFAWMGISKNRFSAGSVIAGQQPQAAFILDDGFQHRKLHRNLDIVVIDPSQPLRTNRIFPLGTLREPVSELRRSHIVVLNGSSDTEAFCSIEAEIRSLHQNARIFSCTQTIQNLVPFPQWKKDPECGDFSGKVRSAYLATAVGNPERFQRDIQQLGIEVRGCRFYRDHYRLQPKDWAACSQEAQSKGVEAIVTTEKDAIKISQPPEFPIRVAVQSVKLSDADGFRQALKKSIAFYPSI